MIEFTVETESDLTARAADLAGLLPPGAVLALAGDLGAGKTSLARALIRARCGDPTLTVTSPTFNLLGRYDGPNGLILHYDLYRLKDPREWEELGVDDITTADLTVIEWPERLAGGGPSITHLLTFQITGPTSRRLVLTRMDLEKDLDTAFIFAAGLGTRMAALTASTPKPLISVNGRPILAYIFDQLGQVGIKRLILNTHYLPEQIEKFLDSYRDRFDIQTHYEETLLETGGGLLAALPLIDRPYFFVLNGDALQTDAEGLSHLTRLAVRFDPSKMDLLLLVSSLEAPTITPGFGDYTIRPDGTLVEALQKSGTVFFAGPRIVDARLLAGLKPGKFSFKQQMDQAEAKGRLYGLIHRGLYHHLSTPKDIQDVGAFLRGEQAPKVLNHHATRSGT